MSTCHGYCGRRPETERPEEYLLSRGWKQRPGMGWWMCPWESNLDTSLEWAVRLQRRMDAEAGQ